MRAAMRKPVKILFVFHFPPRKLFWRSASPKTGLSCALLKHMIILYFHYLKHMIVLYIHYLKHTIIYTICNIQLFTIFGTYDYLQYFVCLSACLFDHLSCSAGVLLVVYNNQTFLGLLLHSRSVQTFIKLLVEPFDKGNGVRVVGIIYISVSE